MSTGTEATHMRLYIVRHGKAEQDSPSGRDADRPLKPKGVRQAKYLGECFAKAERKPELILTSGYSRAIHTATIIQAVLGCRLDSAAELESGRPLSDVVDLIARHGRLRSLMIVGHNPQLGMLVGALALGVGGNTTVLKTGEAVIVDVPAANCIGSGRIIDRVRLDEPCDSPSAQPPHSALQSTTASLSRSPGSAPPGSHLLAPGGTYLAGGGWMTTPSLRLALRR